MPRKDPLAHLHSEQPQTPLDQMLIAKPKPKRERVWEKDHRARLYRGVPGELRDQVKVLASDMNVPADEVARAFVEAGLVAWEQGELPLEPQPKAQRMTLFPEGGWTGWQPSGGGVSKPAARKSSGRKSTKGSEEPLWKLKVGYRFPADLHERLASMARDLNVPIGEVLTMFLNRGLGQVESGALALNPTVKAVRMTLHGGGA